MNLIGFLVAFI